MNDTELRHLFHTLWTKAVGTDTYAKPEWEALRTELMKRLGLEL